jgi:hypothetical protein
MQWIVVVCKSISMTVRVMRSVIINRPAVIIIPPAAIAKIQMIIAGNPASINPAITSAI